ncbi:hypothetical protein K9N68_29255 [Kovacikia minuta CCNUW1]|uniref:clostripain-related cysteine peptidase n=1 Tax=Kovacikia minuta TaxID=2931930 RepID=UPI001CCE103B|nr:clostripain-related cysteine peptidase [Kovacikia minuta]UBF25612.1 hypothetical protein K9N68_29255 [Kovacikia minuta CCNUW1]
MPALQQQTVDAFNIASRQWNSAASQSSTLLSTGGWAERVDPLQQRNWTSHSGAATAIPDSTSVELSAMNGNLQLGGDRSNHSATPPANWTVMVYMAGDSLEEFGIQDFLEMSAIGSSSNVNVVVQFDRTAGYADTHGDWTDTRRGVVQAGDTPDLNWGSSLGEVNMGDASTLYNFVDWGMANYQAENYAVIMWGHGDGFNVSYDDTTGDSISAIELNTVLGAASEEIDLVGTDACLMSSLDFTDAIRDNASVFVGSQELEPGTGWNYTPILQDLNRLPTMTAAQLGADIVYHYGEYYNSPGGNDPYTEETLSAIDLSALRDSNSNSLVDALNLFQITAAFTATTYDTFALASYEDVYSNEFGAGNTPEYYDIGNFYTSIADDEYISSSIRAAAEGVLDAYDDAIISNYSSVPGRSTGLSIDG